MYANKHFSSYEIIVVDDGSTDNTAGLVTDLSSTLRNLRLIRNNANKGKGYTVKNGVLHSKYDKILFCDAELSTPIQELNNLIKFIGNYDIVVGTRTDKKRLKQNNHSLEYFLAKHTQN
jgi:dolichyl-phosphate beta-glucosyltransferase